MKSSNRVERFLNLTLSLIHPDLFQTGLGILKKLRHLKTTDAIAEEWQSVYTGVNVISNRITQAHRDSKGRPEWFDTLASYCGSNSTPRLLINNLGLDLQYSSGAVVGFCGLIFQHEVGAWGPGDRVCQAHFMRESVRARLGIPPAGWVNQSRYYQHLPS